MGFRAQIPLYYVMVFEPESRIIWVLGPLGIAIAYARFKVLGVREFSSGIFVQSGVDGFLCWTPCAALCLGSAAKSKAVEAPSTRTASRFELRGNT